MRCESCGAELPQKQSICQYCGASCDRMVAATAASSCGANVFEQIKQSEVWADRNSPNRQASLPQMPALATVAPTVFLVVFIAVSAFMALMALGMAGLFGVLGFSVAGPAGGMAIVPALMALMPIGLVVLGIYMIRKQRKIVSDYQSAPILPQAAVIIGKRTQVFGGGDSSASTRYYLSAELEDGRRAEFTAMQPALYGQVSEGDAGILFVRGTYALDFDRVVV